MAEKSRLYGRSSGITENILVQEGVCMNLKSLREDKLKISIEDMAQFLNKTVDEVLAMEENSELIDLKTLKMLAEKTNMTLDEIEAYGNYPIQMENKKFLNKFDGYVKKTKITEFPKMVTSQIKEVGLVDKINSHTKDLLDSESGHNVIDRIKNNALANKVASAVRENAENIKENLIGKKITFLDLLDKMPKISFDRTLLGNENNDEKAKNDRIKRLTENVIISIKRYKNESMRRFVESYENSINVGEVVGLINSYGITKKSSRSEVERMLKDLECHFKNNINEILSVETNNLGNEIQLYIVKYSYLRFGDPELCNKKWFVEHIDLRDGISCTIDDYSDCEEMFRFLKDIACDIGWAFDPTGGFVAEGISYVADKVLDKIYSEDDFRKKLAENIVREYKKQNVLKVYVSKIDAFWDDNEKRFNKLVKDMDKAYKEYSK